MNWVNKSKDNNQWYSPRNVRVDAVVTGSYTDVVDSSNAPDVIDVSCFCVNVSGVGVQQQDIESMSSIGESSQTAKKKENTINTGGRCVLYKFKQTKHGTQNEIS